eukprot:12341196-Alexandrium_andersonii.AAC.1
MMVLVVSRCGSVVDCGVVCGSGLWCRSGGVAWCGVDLEVVVVVVVVGVVMVVWASVSGVVSSVNLRRD